MQKTPAKNSFDDSGRAQLDRFLEAAEKAGVDKSGRKFVAAMRKVARAKPKK
jgi:hypothetical protein